MGSASKFLSLFFAEVGGKGMSRQKPGRHSGCNKLTWRPAQRRAFALILSSVFFLCSPSLLRAELELNGYSFGANSAIVATLGQVGYISGCPAGGINDFIYPWADVYIVPSGSTALSDVSNAEGVPNTLQYIILDETLGYTGPGGYLMSGDYAVVIDECQDGTFQPGVDWYGAEFSVHIPANIDPFTSAIFASQLAATKGAADTQGERWIETELMYRGLFDAYNAITLYSIATDPADFLLFACTNINFETGEVYCSLNDAWKGLLDLQQNVLNTILNQAFYYKGIAADPPDANYKALAGLQTQPLPDFALTEPWMTAIVRSAQLAAQDAALAEALLHSMERYQGAEQAGIGEYAFVQARLAEKYARALAELAPRLAASVHDVATAAAASGVDFVAIANNYRTTQARVASIGLTATETTKLISAGWDNATIAAAITDYLNRDFSGLQTADDLSNMATQLTANASTLATALTSFADAMAAEQTALAAQLRLPFPNALAGGPYTINEGTNLILDGSGSGHADLTDDKLTFEWDTDLDGNFDDATGSGATVTFPRERQGYIGLKVSTPNGYSDISYALLTVNNVNSSPVINSASPDTLIPISHAQSQVFSIAASDADNEDVLTYTWDVDGDIQAAETANAFTFNATLDAVGEHVVTVTVSDGSPLSADTRHFWRLTVTSPDNDQDGYGSNIDCNDANAAIHPGAAEIYQNGIDDDCNPATPDNPDADNDGSLYTTDCDDHNAAIHPGAAEFCNSIDDNCNGSIDEGFDADNDGITTCAGDCDDGNNEIYPGVAELCNNIDDNCDGSIDEGLDADGDGVTICAGDCDNTNADIFPAAVELCNGIDDNCDSSIDEGFDTDGDGFTTCNGDCDDANAGTYPGAQDVCDGKDNDCDGSIDEFVNDDADGDGVSVCAGDCDDASNTIYPGAVELCNNVDDNCDLLIDNLDADGDGYNGCTNDCDDSNADIFPGRPEITMNGKDDDCDPFTKDSYADTFMISTDDGGRIYYARSNGNGTWSGYRFQDILYGTTRGVAIADFDNDNDFDFIVPAWSSQLDIYLFKNNGNDTFINAGSVGTVGSTGNAYGMTAGDYNNDGNEDFLISGDSVYVVLGLGDGMGGFTVSTINTGSGNGRAMDTADFNHDGNLDYVRATYSAGSITLYLGKGDGTFTNAGIVADPGQDPYGVAAADFNNDGHPDLVANYGNNGDAYFYAGNGNGTFQAGVYVASIDFNNYGGWDNYDYNADGNQDLISVNYSGRNIHYYPGNGNGSFGAAVLVSSPQTSSSTLGVSAPPVTTMPPPPVNPQAVIFPGRVEDSIGATVDFDGGFSTDDGPIVSYEWNFDDGQTATGETVTHTFPAQEKDYIVRLTVTDDSGKKSIASAIVRLKDALPVAAAGGTYTFGESFASGGIYTVTLDGSGSSDDSSISRYVWKFSDSWTDDFNDGNADDWTFPVGTWSISNGQLQQTNTSLSRTYALAGTEVSGDYEFSADVKTTGGSGLEAILIFRSQDTNNHYEFIFRGRSGTNDILLYRYVNGGASSLLQRTLPFTVQTNTTYRLKVKCIGSNIELFVNDSLVGKLTDSTYLRGQVGFATYVASAVFDNVRVDYFGQGAKPQHQFKEGSYSAELTVTDSVGQTDSDTATINLVKGNPPVANPGGPYIIDETGANCGKWTKTFNGSGSTDDSGIWKYEWNFGDGTTGTGVNPTHIYNAGGTYTVTLTVTDNSLQTHSATTTVTTMAGAPPTANPGGPYNFSENVANSGLWTASLSGSGSSDPNGICDYSWNFGDSTSGTGVAPTHQYNAVNTYTVTLTVRDHALQSHSQTTTVTIAANNAPVADHGGPYTINESMAKGGIWTASFNATASNDDFGIWKYEWNFGDGTTGTGATPTHLYNATGSYPVTLTVTDNGRLTATVSTTMTVTANDPPVADAGPGRVAEVGQPVLLDGSASTDDFGIFSYNWDFTLPPFSDNFSTGIDPSIWNQSGATLASGEAVITGAGSWTNRYLGTQETFSRKGGDSYTGHLRTTSGGNRYVMWGLKNTTADYNYTQFYYAIYFNNNNILIYEGGTNRGDKGDFVDNTDYDLRIDLKDGQGASYYYRQTGSPDWIVLYDSTYSNATAFRFGATVNSGTISFDDFSAPATSGPSSSLPAVQVTYNAPGTYHPAITITDNALQTDTATTTITVLQGQAPVADTGGPYSTNEDIPTRFNGRKSSDDFGIKWYVWDFGDGSSLKSRNPFADHRYTAAGSYTVTLAVTDFSGQTSVDQTTVNVSADPVVACVPWQFTGGVEMPHDTWSGKQITLKGVAWSLRAPLSYTWDFGDGSAPVSGTVSNKYKIEAKHAYTGVEGAPFIATLTVTDADGRSASDNYLVRIRTKSLDIETNVAIDESLWYLHGKQSRSEATGILYGSWVTESPYGGYYASAISSSVQAFAINGHSELGDVKKDPYTETVSRGLHSLFTYLTSQAIGVQTYGDPDTNGNRLGITVTGSRPIYEGGMVMDAIASTGSSGTFADTGAVNIKDRSYLDIGQDMIDQYAWGQDDNSTGGGWRYSWGDWPDNSAAQWGAIGSLALQEVFGIDFPEWVKERNKVWLNTSFNGYGFGYTGAGNGNATTPSGMVQMVMDGLERTDPKWIAAENEITKYWYSGWNYKGTDNYYALFALSKAMRLALPAPVVTLSGTGAANGLDWFADPVNGLARALINDVFAGNDGSFTGSPSYVGQPLRSAWGVIMLTPTLFVQPPVADAGDDRVWGVDVPLTLDGSGSYHLDPFRNIVLYEWDLDGDGVFDTSSSDPKITYIYTSANYPEATLPRNVAVKLRVTDNNDPTKTDIDSIVITIAVPPHPPVANAGGPYTCTAGLPCTLDGSASFDIDPTDFITSWQWDLNGDFVYGDASGETVSATFDTPGARNIGLRVLDNAVMNDVNGNGVQDTDEQLEDFDFATLNVVANLGPVADAGGPYTVDEGSAVALDGSGSHDPNGDPLTYQWDLDNDGAFDNAAGIHPNYTGIDDGDYTIGIEVSDGLLSDSATATVTVNNLPPVVNAGQNQTTLEGAAFSGNGSFTDPGLLDVHSATVNYGDGSGVQPLALSGKTFTLGHTYRDNGVYTVTITVTDDDGGSGSGTLSVTAGNMAPNVNAGPDATINEGGTFDGTGSFSDQGIDDTHTATVDYGDGSGAQPLVLNPDGSFSLSHVYPENGLYSVTVRVTDDDGGVGTDTALVTVNNLAPVVDAGPDLTATAGDAVNLTQAFFSDAGVADTHTAMINWGDGTVETGTVNEAAKTVSGSHVYSSAGPHTITVTVNDDDGDSDSDTLTVTVAEADLCPDDPAKSVPGVCGCGVADTDADNDGTMDCNDLCPNDPAKSAPGVCGCGVADTDADNDGTMDCNDLCPNDPAKIDPGACGCGVADTDANNNGVADCKDPVIPEIKDLMARAKDGKIDVVWTHVGAPSYNVYRSTVKGGPYSFIAKTTSTYSVYADFGLTNGITYCYVVRPMDAAGNEISQSNEACGIPKALRTR